MKTALVISEYNPFHLGHKYQIEDIRKNFGEDTRIIALMSGNYTQRGQTAILDKFQRAKCAVLSGVNLVLELPFPYSSSSSELFSKAAINIANDLGTIDILAFGSECGDVNVLKRFAEEMLSDKFKAEYEHLSSDKKYKALGYPKICELAHKNVFGSDIDPSFFSPNNILALDYLKALIITNSNIKPYTTKRIGSSYNEENIAKGNIQSATAIRNESFKDVYSALNYIPENNIDIILEQHKKGNFPCDTEKLSSAIISFFRLNYPSDTCTVHDAEGGLYNRLISKSHEATSIENLVKLCSTKKYTDARIRRAIWYCFFGVTSSDVKSKPEFTQILAMDSIGQALIRSIKKNERIEVITKPASKPIGKKAIAQKALSDRADLIFDLTKPTVSAGISSLRSTPFVKKDE